MKTSLLNKMLTSKAGVAALILRAPIGLILAAHGAQKLFAWFGGYGLEGTGQWMASIGITPGYLMALLAGSAEFFGGLALVLGLLTRPAAVVSAFTMLIAIFSSFLLETCPLTFRSGLHFHTYNTNFTPAVDVITIAMPE